MDYAWKWSALPTAPSLKHLTEAGFGIPKEKQHEAVQDLVKAHIESFDEAVTDGLCRVVQVSALRLGLTWSRAIKQYCHIYHLYLY